MDKVTAYWSECGNYIAVQIGSSGNYEVVHRDGRRWLHDDRIKTWEDAAKRRHPLPLCVGGYTAEMTGQKKGSFTLNLLRCDTRKYIKPWTGNTVVESAGVVFRRKIPYHQAASIVERTSKGEK